MNEEMGKETIFFILELLPLSFAILFQSSTLYHMATWKDYTWGQCPY